MAFLGTETQLYGDAGLAPSDNGGGFLNTLGTFINTVGTTVSGVYRTVNPPTVTTPGPTTLPSSGGVVGLGGSANLLLLAGLGVLIFLLVRKG